MSKTRYNFKRIPAQCLIDIYTGLSLELKKQPFGKRNFRRALVSWKDTGARLITQYCCCIGNPTKW